MSESHESDETRELLAQTIRRFVAPGAVIVTSESHELPGGMSGAALRRHTVRYRTSQASAQASLVTKQCDRHEWRVLQHLQSQRQPNIPFAHAIDAHGTGRLLVCMQDLGDQHRPTSLEPITDEFFAREAAGLAAIHAANFEPSPALGWLPTMDAGYVREMLFERAWRPAWEAATASARFAAAFRDAIPRVEAAAATIVEDMRALLGDEESHTLIHADLNPSNVLVRRGVPYFVDWQTAMRGPFYIDLPHHHCTLAHAEHYRRALLARGRAIAPGVFAERYRVAARYIGLRYMWWTLENWLEDQTQAPWVRHYVGLVTGDGIGAILA
jgi:hypothetical protein